MSTTADIRLNCTLPSHPKTQKLIRRLGEAAAWNLVVLLTWAGQNRRDGDLDRLTDEDIEIAAAWRGAAGAFVAALVDVGFLDGGAGARELHDWCEHQPWQTGSKARSDKARWAAIRKHHGAEEAARQMPEYAARLAARGTANAAPSDDEHASLAGSDAEGMPEDAAGMPVAEPSMPLAESSSAPSPSPSPRAEDQKPPHSPPLGGDDGPAPSARAGRRRQETLTLAAYAARCRARGEPEIADDDPVFRYAAGIGLPRDFVVLAWWRFSNEHADSQKRQASWPRKFRNSVEGNWYRLWWKSGETWALTTAGKQAQADMAAALADDPAEEPAP